MSRPPSPITSGSPPRQTPYVSARSRSGARPVGESGAPGVGFDGAGGFKAKDWPVEVEKCVRFQGYPSKMP